MNNATDQDLWGGYLNANWSGLDGLLYTATNWVHRGVTGNDVADFNDRNKILISDAAAGSYIQTLPSAAAVGDGFSIGITKADATANTVTIARAGSDTINGLTSYILANQNDGVVLVSNGVSVWNFLVNSVSLIVPDASTTVKGIIQIATAADALATTSALLAMTPATMASHPGVAKAWVRFVGSSATISKSYNVTSVVRNSAGNYTITFTTAFADANFAESVSMVCDGNNAIGYNVSASSASTLQIAIRNQSGTSVDPTRVSVLIHD